MIGVLAESESLNVVNVGAIYGRRVHPHHPCRGERQGATMTPAGFARSSRWEVRGALEVADRRARAQRPGGGDADSGASPPSSPKRHSERRRSSQTKRERQNQLTRVVGSAVERVVDAALILGFDGKVLVQDGRLARVDEAEVYAKAREATRHYWGNVPTWRWDGAGVDRIIPPAFPLHRAP